MRHRLSFLAAVLTVSLVSGAAAVPSAGSVGSVENPVGAVAAAELLAAGAQGTSYFPPELIDELGYHPGTRSGLAANTSGDCSSPVPMPESFEPACMIHDLGYDLLRVADRVGERIPASTRRDLDRQMAAQMAASCDGASACRAMAGVAHAAVAANTLRQGNGAPVEEWFPWSGG